MRNLNEEQIEALGFASVGKNVMLSDKASFHGCSRISIGDGTRIDDFSVLSAGEGGISIGRDVHIAVGVMLIGSAAIEISDFSGLSGRVAVYSSSDAYSGSAVICPTISKQLTNIRHDRVRIEKYVIIGAISFVFPCVALQQGVAIGALSTVTKTYKQLSIYFGGPANILKKIVRHAG